MDYNTTYTKIYRELLQTNGEFNMKKVMITAYLSSPEHFTKKQIKEIALRVLDDLLNNGMIKNVGEGVYQSIYSQNLTTKEQQRKTSKMVDDIVEKFRKNFEAMSYEEREAYLKKYGFSFGTAEEKEL